jgi:hypothetical protein
MRALTPSGSRPTSRPSDRGASGRRLEQAAQHPDRRGFARSVAAEETKDLAPTDIKRHVVHGFERAEVA